MTLVEFTTGNKDKLRAACAAAERALARRETVLVLTPDARVSEELDRLLWSWSGTSFLPHCRAAHHLAADTPVVVDHEPGPDFPPRDLLVNLCSDTPPGFARHARVLEVVGEDEADRRAGRERWRYYKERGHELRHLGEAAGAEGQP